MFEERKEEDDDKFFYYQTTTIVNNLNKQYYILLLFIFTVMNRLQTIIKIYHTESSTKKCKSYILVFVQHNNNVKKNI